MEICALNISFFQIVFLSLVHVYFPRTLTAKWGLQGLPFTRMAPECLCGGPGATEGNTAGLCHSSDDWGALCMWKGRCVRHWWHPCISACSINERRYYFLSSGFTICTPPPPAASFHVWLALSLCTLQLLWSGSCMPLHEQETAILSFPLCFIWSFYKVFLMCLFSPTKSQIISCDFCIQLSSLSRLSCLFQVAIVLP